jgi:glyceraldehyde 3-phosphate dehydrogenase
MNGAKTECRRVKVGINGLGRFGLHLVQYWIENYDDALFDIAYINDELLDFEHIKEIIKTDAYLKLKSHINFGPNGLLEVNLGGLRRKIDYTNSPFDCIPWAGKVSIFLECSGRHTSRTNWDSVVTEKTELVIISATSLTADYICIFGHNHKNTNLVEQKILSYGSCTVNAYVPLASLIYDTWGIDNSDVNVIHNIPVHRAHDFKTLERRTCTLEKVALMALPFLNDDNFIVNYTVVPHTGVSMIDFRFKLKQEITRDEVIRHLKSAIQDGQLRGLYDIADTDEGPAVYKFTKYSAVLVEPNIHVRGHNLYIGAYFDNENSVNRYFDVINYAIHEECRG